jgi:hypothetical protein
MGENLSSRPASAMTLYLYLNTSGMLARLGCIAGTRLPPEPERKGNRA